MAYLVLSLKDLLITKLDSKINVAQQRSSYVGFYLDGKRNKVYFQILNLGQIIKLIIQAYSQNDGVIIMTSGSYCRSIVSEIAFAMRPWLPKDVLEQFQDCKFHSADTDAALFNIDKHKIARMSKCDRLKQLVRHTPELKGKYFITLDSSRTQVRAFEGQEKMYAVWAPMSTADNKGCYYETTSMLHFAAVCEKDGKHLSNTIALVKKYYNLETFEPKTATHRETPVVESPVRLFLESSELKHEVKSTINARTSPVKKAVAVVGKPSPDKISKVSPSSHSREPFKNLLNLGALTFKPDVAVKLVFDDLSEDENTKENQLPSR